MRNRRNEAAYHPTVIPWATESEVCVSSSVNAAWVGTQRLRSLFVHRCWSIVSTRCGALLTVVARDCQDQRLTLWSSIVRSGRCCKTFIGSILGGGSGDSTRTTRRFGVARFDAARHSHGSNCRCSGPPDGLSDAAVFSDRLPATEERAPNRLEVICKRLGPA
jgi:hypothetical protein